MKMRLKIRLKSLARGSQKDNWHKYSASMRGWLFRKLAGTAFSDMHDSRDFKPFCFSNLIGIQKGIIETDRNYFILFSFAQRELLETVRNRIVVGETFNIADILFRVEQIKPCKVRVGDYAELGTPTGIVLTEKRNEKIYCINARDDGLEYFKKALSKNLIKKFNQFNDMQVPEDYPLFIGTDLSLHKRPVVSVLHRISEGKSFFTVASKVQFNCGLLDNVQKQILNFCLETGFGTHSTYGMGFIEVRNKKTRRGD